MASRAEQNSWASQAALNALLRYAPQKAALGELRKAAEDRFHESVQAGRSEGVLGQRAAQAAVAPTQQIFSSARASGERGRSLVAPILAALSPDSPFRAAQAGEEAAGKERLGQSEAHALSDLQQRAVASSELPAYARQGATATLLKELQKIASKDSLLEGSQGADIQSEIGKQRGEARKQAQAERANERTTQASENNSRRSSGTSRANSQESNRTRKEIAEGKLPGGGVKPLTTKEQNTGISTVQAIRQVAGPLIRGGHTRAEVVERLQQGTPSVSGKTKAGNSFKTRAIPGYKPDALMSAAIDMAERGGVRQHTWNQLTAAGYTPAYLSSQGIKVKEPEQTGLHSHAHTG